MGGKKVPGPAGVADGGEASARGPAGVADGGEASARGPVGVADGGALDYDAFKEAVLARQIKNARAGGKTYYAAVPKEELGKIEGKHQMRSAAAAKCNELLAAARAALEVDKGKSDAKAMLTSAIGIGSSYRDYDYDKGLWDKYYPNYYLATQTDRDAAAGGPHGKDAVQILAKYISPKKAAPGFSNHSNGTAVDFTTTVNGKALTDLSSHEAWQATWLHAWLKLNAGTYRFYELVSEEWHWDYR